MEIAELYNLYKNHPNICTDTRKIEKGSIFFALKGKKFNGNYFAAKAISKGCDFAIIDEKKFRTNDKYILVNNVLETLQNLAKHHREQIDIPILGITGSNGKTTSKELIYSVLNKELNCYATKGNLNNHIGVPLSILEINNKHQIAIIEMGANHRNEIKDLCEISKPNYGIITNIGLAHLEGFQNLQGVIDTKNELYNFIKLNNGSLFVNNDDEILVKLSKQNKIIFYGFKSNLNATIKKNSPFVNVFWNKININSKLIGDYQFYNISLAICIGNYFNISKKNIKSGIEEYTPKNNRSEIINTQNNMLIMDAYNANPSSMTAMLTSFAHQDYQNKLCILGDMLELGNFSNEQHIKIIKLCQKLKIDTLFVGKEFYRINKKAFQNLNELQKFIKEKPIKNKTILLKGSRSVNLEELVSYL